MPSSKFQPFTHPRVLQQIPPRFLARFFARFKSDLEARNCRLPSAPPGSEAYCNCWAELLAKPEALPDSLVQAMTEIVEQAAPANWPRLEAAAFQAQAARASSNTPASREALALQLWLQSKEKQETEERARFANGNCDPATAIACPSEPRASASGPNAQDTPAFNPEPTSLPSPVDNDQPVASGAPGQAKTKSLGKIKLLPPEIREQLNLRLENGDEDAKTLLEWLNGLPQVQVVLAKEFGGRPLSKQNLSEWKQHGYRHWQIRRAAIEFAQNLDADQASLASSLTGPLTEKLSHWAALRYAAAAQALAGMDDDPETELRRLREFCTDIVALRRGDLCAGRLGVEQARLAAELADNEAQKEKEFWSWTQRADIQAKLYPKRDPEKTRREVVRMIDREFLGIRHPADDQNELMADPAVFI